MSRLTIATPRPELGSPRDRSAQSGAHEPQGNLRLSDVLYCTRVVHGGRMMPLPSRNCLSQFGVAADVPCVTKT